MYLAQTFGTSNSPNLLSNSIVSPSEQTLLGRSPRLLNRESPDQEVTFDYPESVRAVVGGLPHGRIVTLDVDLKDSNFRIMSADVTFSWMEQFQCELLYSASRLNKSESSLSGLVSCLYRYAHTQEVGGSRVWPSALLPFALSQSISAYLGEHSGFNFLITLKKLTSTDSEIDIFGHSSMFLGSGKKIDPSSMSLICKLLFKPVSSIKFDLEQKHNPAGRRSGSCETIESTNSFLSDPVVDWNELLYGYN